MKYVYIGKETVETMDDIHSVFAKALDFPEYYGKNLDALHDCLTEVSSDCVVLLADKGYLQDTIGPKFDVLMELLNDVALENDYIFIREFI